MEGVTDAVPNHPVMRRMTLLIAMLCIAGLPAHALDEVCTETPDPARWEEVGTPDPPVDHMRITVHRGAANLAPEDTIPAFEYAIAYGMDMIEVDVQQTVDNRFVVLHDYDIAKKTNGSGYVFTKTYDEMTRLSAADHGDWAQSESADVLVPGLEAVLALASEHGVGINFDLKESVANAAGVALLASQYEGIIERSIFQPYVPARAEAILAVAPNARIMHNSQLEDPPGAVYYAIAQEYDWFGSSLPDFSAEAIAAIHDACDFVQPNVYQGDVTGSEAGDLAYARDIGADGAMVNNPDVAAAVLGRPVATSFRLEPDHGRACLVGRHGLGMPRKSVHVGDVTVETRRGGCVAWAGESLRFDGDPSALAAAA